MKKTVMRKYAQLAVRRGAHVKKGQGCVIYAQVEQHEFAQLVAEEAYRAGAKWVEMRWEDQVCTKLKYRHETLTQLSQVAEWEKARMQHYVDTLPAMIHISSADPDGLKGVNVEKMQKSGAARGMALKSYHDALDNKYQWCIIAVPSKKWAKKVFPGERTSAAVEKLWEAILQTVRVTEDNDPMAEWEAHDSEAESPLREAQRPGFGLPPLPGAQRHGLQVLAHPGGPVARRRGHAARRHLLRPQHAHGRGVHLPHAGPLRGDVWSPPCPCPTRAT